MNIIKKTTAFIFALLFVAGAPAVVPVGFSASNSAITAEAASCFSFDSATGTLTLKGNIIVDEVRAFQKESNLSVKAIIAAPGSVLPSNCSNLFSTFTAAETIDLSKANSQNVTDMTAMFYNCFNATSISVKGFDTSNVTSMALMFSKCQKLREIDLSSFNTSRVTGMGGMFKECYYLSSIDLSNFDATSLEGMGSMFEDCRSLTSLDLSPMYTSKVKDMSSMFAGCKNLKTLDFGIGFSTYSVTNMYRMFCSCENLSSIDLSGFVTYNVTRMDEMFLNCKKLTSLDLSSFNTSNVTTSYRMFGSCSSLVTLNISNFDTHRFTSMGSMFSGCSSLTSLDVSNFNTSNVTDIGLMFSSCSSLTNLDVSKFNTANVTRMDGMFYGCESLKTLDLNNFDTSRVTNTNTMFAYCNNLKTILVSKSWNVNGNTDRMFKSCNNLIGIRGTRYNDNHTDGTYARIDGKGGPGYFTKKAVEFTTNSVTLGGAISLNFFTNLSAVPAQNLSKTYVEFEVNGKKQTAKFNPNKMNSAKTAYGFNCKLDSVSMADTVNAKLVYYTTDGTAHNITTASTCEDYYKKFNENDKPATWNLIKSINDYGYYMQRYLCNHAKTKWVLGVDHKAMEKAYTSEADFAAKKSTYLNELSAYKKQISINKDIEKANFSLVLESDTTLNLKIKPASGYTGSISYKLDGKPVTATKIDNGRYQVSVPGISAHLLNEAHTLEIITDSGTSTFTVSALSYAYECVKAPLDTSEYNAMCALYDYYKATVAYKK